MSHESPGPDDDLHERPAGRFPVKTTAAIALVALAAFGAALLPNLRKHKEAREFNDLTATPVVAVTTPKPGEAVRPLVLPAQVVAFADATVYARTDGYLKARHVDIGSRVKVGDILAEIDAPEVDAQLARARASLEQARADTALAELTARRIETLADTNAVSKQEVDDKRGDVLAKKASRAVAEAEVVRLEQLVAFRRVTAPFDGVITERNTDVGDLIAAGSGPRSLFHIANPDTLRVFVRVPEDRAGDVRIGDPATVTFTATPGIAPEGEVAGTAGAIDPASRTLLTEIRLPNADGKLLPGAYAQVTLKLKNSHAGHIVPINVLIFRPEGAFVGTVDADSRVKLKPVKIGRNFGSSVEIAEGLDASDRIITNPSDSILNGAKVEIFTPAAKP